MSNHCEILKMHYENLQKNIFDLKLYTQDLIFTGPLAETQGVGPFKQRMLQMHQIVHVQAIKFIARFKNDNNQACAIFDMVTTKPFQGTTRCCELFTFNLDGKIKTIDLLYNQTEKWAEALQRATN